ncbi:MAG TPA: DUF2459 domain-containing protein [Candidatus Binatia bacterium]
MILPGSFQRKILAALFILCAALALGHAHALSDWACAPGERYCRSVYVVHNAWHAGIVLRHEDLTVDTLPELNDFPGARFVEFSWGDKDYFPDPDAGISLGLKAAFWSSGSVLHLVGLTKSLQAFYPSAQIVELRLALPAYARLIAYLSRSFSRPQTGKAQASPGLVANGRFYPSIHRFSLLNTCNTWVAEALQTAGLPVWPGLVITAGQLAEQIAKIKDADSNRLELSNRLFTIRAAPFKMTGY